MNISLLIFKKIEKKKKKKLSEFAKYISQINFSINFFI